MQGELLTSSTFEMSGFFEACSEEMEYNTNKKKVAKSNERQKVWIEGIDHTMTLLA